MANGTIAFDTLSTSGQIDGVARSIDTDYLLNGSAKAWVQGSSDTTFRDKFNVGSGTDNGTGDYTYTFTNNMANNDYACSGLVIDSAPRIGNISAIATGSYTVQYHNESGESRDTDNSTTIHGDLA